MKSTGEMTENEFYDYMRKAYNKLKDPADRELFIQIQQLYFAAGGAMLHFAERTPNKACIKDDVRSVVIHAVRAAKLTKQSAAKIAKDDEKALRAIPSKRKR